MGIYSKNHIRKKIKKFENYLFKLEKNQKHDEVFKFYEEKLNVLKEKILKLKKLEKKNKLKKNSKEYNIFENAKYELFELERSKLKLEDIVLTKLYLKLGEASTKFQRREILLDFYKVDLSKHKNKRKKEILKEIDRKIKSAGPQYIYFPSNIDRHSSKFLNKLQNIK